MLNKTSVKCEKNTIKCSFYHYLTIEHKIPLKINKQKCLIITNCFFIVKFVKKLKYSNNVKNRKNMKGS